MGTDDLGFGVAVFRDAEGVLSLILDFIRQ